MLPVQRECKRAQWHKKSLLSVQNVSNQSYNYILYWLINCTTTTSLTTTIAAIQLEYFQSHMCTEWRFVNLFTAWLVLLRPTIHFQLTKITEGAAAATLWNSCHCQKWTLLSCGNSCNCLPLSVSLSIAINRSNDCAKIGRQTPFGSYFALFPFYCLHWFACSPSLSAAGQFAFSVLIVHSLAVHSFRLSLLFAFFHGQCHWTLHLHYLVCPALLMQTILLVWSQQLADCHPGSCITVFSYASQKYAPQCHFLWHFPSNCKARELVIKSRK